MTLLSLNSSSLDNFLLQKLSRVIGHAPIRIVLPSGSEICPRDATPAGTLVIRDRQTLLRIILSPEIEFGDAYTEGRAEIDGDMVEVLAAVFRALSGRNPGSWFARLSSKLLERTQANTLHGSREHIHRHYDLSTDFYKLWLDSEMLYTCAYFESPSVSLEAAQIDKMDLVCRKLQLQRGERVVEAGCGWGAFALYMAEHYGVRVKAFNISQEQLAYARATAKRRGLADCVEFIEDDYRNIRGTFDVFVSVGMLEHVGTENYPALREVIHSAIGNSGRGLLHFIGMNRPRPLSAWIRKRIFPGANPPTLSQMMPSLFEPWNYSVLDVENLRLHYAQTLRHWRNRFERSTDRVAQMFGEQFVRLWRLYLAGSEAGFVAGSLQLFQLLFAGSECRQIPWTRAHLYEKLQPAKQEAKWMHAAS
ncbi:MAG TPA: cyclopropane-fatty-acyl-phospholipid synthase family protein [Candidatus Acidoferrales bacterium]|jgi:cyclopropane-fatty-acyl-phospholipid synthase|nr:cyclopropane-fatty-acyl-phospholipid synthase family protein [Candidatus Acidoferrales bacterium]